MQQAIDAFSGVLEPPDVPLAAPDTEHAAFAGVTSADIADALAANSADYDATEVLGTASALRPPEWLQTEGITLRPDSGTGDPSAGSSAQRR